MIFQKLVEYYINQSWPFRAQLELTKSCNFKCLHCYQMNRSTNKVKDPLLRFESWNKLLHSLQNNKIIFIRLTGGEPTLHPDFCRIYKMAKKLGLKVEIQTNGSLLRNEKIIDTLTQYIPRIVRISIYGFSKEIYEVFCKKGKYFDYVIDGINKLRERKIPLKLILVVTRENLQDSERIMEYCQTYELNTQVHFSLTNSLDSDNIILDHSVNRIDLLDHPSNFPLLTKRIIEQEQSHKKITLWENDAKVCWGGLLSTYIDENHNMFLCPPFRKKSVSLKEVSFEKAWQQMRDLRRKVILKPNPCTLCTHRNFCGKCSPFFDGVKDLDLLMNHTNCLNKRTII